MTSKINLKFCEARVGRKQTTGAAEGERAQTLVNDLQQPVAPAASDVRLLLPPVLLPSSSSTTSNLEPAGIMLPYTLSADNSVSSSPFRQQHNI